MTQDDKAFLRSVLYFLEEKEDPTRFVGWNAQRCKAVAPALYKAWVDTLTANDILRRVAKSLEGECRDDGD